MIGLDTNVLARYYIQDESDAEAQKQHEAARILMESGEPLMVCKTVLLELEWVMRGYYGFERDEIAGVFRRVLATVHITIEHRDEVERAVAVFEHGFDFADALHHASYRECSEMASFDDKKFVRRANRLGLKPPTIIPQD